MTKTNSVFFTVLILAGIFLNGCSSRLGWGVLLWSIEDPFIPSGTVLPVYIRSNIEKVWVVGVPEGLRGVGGTDRIEIPLWRLEFAGSRRNANKQAQAFADHALIYAENLQDGLPIRDNPDNTGRRAYRLRAGEIIKILAPVQGIPPISATGAPLPGSWYHVLTEDGTTGYCFSYRLNLFIFEGGQLAASVPAAPETAEDAMLETLLSKTWSFESYSVMINQQRLNLADLNRNWRFDPGPETGIARITAPGIDRSFFYTHISADGTRSWRFEGASLSMQLRSDTTLAVNFTEDSGSMRTVLYVALPVDVEDLIIQEAARREMLYNAIFNLGPVYTSNNFGSITFREYSSRTGTGYFSWSGFDLLVPMHIPETALQDGEGSGTVSMDLFLTAALEDRYTGAFTMRFFLAAGGEALLRCMYFLDEQGFRIEITPDTSIDNTVVARRAASPMVLFFFRDQGPF